MTDSPNSPNSSNSNPITLQEHALRVIADTKRRFNEESDGGDLDTEIDGFVTMFDKVLARMADLYRLDRCQVYAGALLSCLVQVQLCASLCAKRQLPMDQDVVEEIMSLMWIAGETAAAKGVLGCS